MSEDADFLQPESEYETYARLHPEVREERERVKRKFKESLEALVKKVNKEIVDEHGMTPEIREALDAAAKDLEVPTITQLPRNNTLVRWDEPFASQPEHHGRWELLTPEDVRFLLSVGIKIN
jgi:hypothetical protein